MIANSNVFEVQTPDLPSVSVLNTIQKVCPDLIYVGTRNPSPAYLCAQSDFLKRHLAVRRDIIFCIDLHSFCEAYAKHPLLAFTAEIATLRTASPSDPIPLIPLQPVTAELFRSYDRIEVPGRISLMPNLGEYRKTLGNRLRLMDPEYKKACLSARYFYDDLSVFNNLSYLVCALSQARCYSIELTVVILPVDVDAILARSGREVYRNICDLRDMISSAVKATNTRLTDCSKMVEYTTKMFYRAMSPFEVLKPEGVSLLAETIIRQIKSAP